MSTPRGLALAGLVTLSTLGGGLTLFCTTATASFGYPFLGQLNGANTPDKAFHNGAESVAVDDKTGDVLVVAQGPVVVVIDPGSFTCSTPLVVMSRPGSAQTRRANPSAKTW